MKIYNPNLHHRRSIRLKRYDYSQAGLYFITLCLQNRNLIFGHIENAEMKLNPFGEIAFKEWQNTAEIRDNIRLHEFIIMPDHMHGIIEIIFSKGQENDGAIHPFQSPSQTIGSIIRGFKISTIKKIKDLILSIDERTGELQFAPILPQKDFSALTLPQNDFSAPILPQNDFSTPIPASKKSFHSNLPKKASFTWLQKIIPIAPPLRSTSPLHISIFLIFIFWLYTG